MKNKELLFLHLLSPMHVGGNYEFSIVDQPIQREGHTGFPKIEASSLKGSIRHDYARRRPNDEKEKAIFGHKDQAGDVIFTDGRILFFPVRSAKGVYALITCPSIMKRFGDDIGKDIAIPDVKENQAYTAQKTNIVLDDKVLLDEYLYEQVTENEDFTKWVEFMEKKINGVTIQEHALLLSDDEFAYFVQHCTEIITRTAINPETNTVEDRFLFDEEYVPTESIFYSVVFSDQHTINELGLDILQIGGNMTLGKGFVKTYQAEVYDK
ncbi:MULTISPECIES: type III-B CRISPR module RAMP protein Cmr4 [Clostridia]|uniref:type III-B CRISPR module RAMP protein Cmr4 n=1 Tax=Clostridia TaxID=186801 RepID=UPI000EA3D589|nr:MULTISPECIES: type III-B CRISPR module RAMP protein Cmr4 [Clostridia]NBJ68371.1 type III-B CRISPR module RAMP protein Cmr4 [Roseburia sp. 1XD42-34]RKI81459.1 type III-B CRISPR module RAMP protein Cmr4 [Clostridium sp. 1xD42-85]